MRFLPNDYLKNIELINEYIDETTEWKKAVKEKVTLINADIEGAELDMLKSMKDVIIQCRPLLATIVRASLQTSDTLYRFVKFLQCAIKFFCNSSIGMFVNRENSPRCGVNIIS